jgi:hypothetical protein
MALDAADSHSGLSPSHDMREDMVSSRAKATKEGNMQAANCKQADFYSPFLSTPRQGHVYEQGESDMVKWTRGMSSSISWTTFHFWGAFFSLFSFSPLSHF